MGAGRLPRRSRALSPPPPPPPLLEPLPLPEQPPGPQHVSERAEPAAQAPSIHPTPLPLPQANPRGLASGSRSQSGQRHAPNWFPHLSNNSRTPLPPAVQLLWGVWGRSPGERLSGAPGCLCVRPFLYRLVPAPCARKLPTASGAHPHPCRSRGPHSLLRAASFCTSFFSCVRLPPLPPAPLAAPLPPVPQFPAERSARFLTWEDFGVQAPESLGQSVPLGLEELGWEIVSRIRQPSGVCVKPFPRQEETQPACALPAQGTRSGC